MKTIRLVVLAFTLFGGLQAYSDTQNTDFVKFSDLQAEDKKAYGKAHKAQFKIAVSGGSRCSGTYISNEGHGLTAAHCITSCMPWPNADGLKAWRVEANDIKGNPSNHKVSANPWSYPRLCEAVIDGEQVQIKVLAGSKGRKSEHMPIDVIFYFKQYYFIVQEEVDSYKEKWLSAFYDGWGMGGDFAIFKRLDKAKKPTSCLKVSRSNSISGNHYSLSYPGKTSLESDKVNEDLYLSRGDIFQGNYFGSEVVVVEDKADLYLNSTLWAFPGSSGAGLVNPEDHSISGVLSAVVGRKGMKGNELPDARFISSKLLWQQAGDVLSKISCD